MVGLDGLYFDLLVHPRRYKKTKYNDSEEQMKKYTLLMSAYGVGSGIDFKFHGQVANTMDAHRMIQHYQEEMGPETADKIVNCMLHDASNHDNGEI